MGKLDGKCVVICYAGGGIGKAAAELFTKEGAAVIVHDDSKEKLDIVGVGKQFVGDLRKKEDADKLIDFAINNGTGKIDVIVNNEDFAMNLSKIKDLTTEQFKETCDLNLRTIWNTMAATYPKMKAQGGNLNVICLSHIAGASGHSKLVDYASVKAGTFGIVKTIAKEWARFETVRSNGLYYANIKFSEDYPEQGPGKKGIKDYKGPTNPFQKVINNPMDIAKVILFLASDDSNALNGEMINATGGWNTVSGE